MIDIEMHADKRQARLLTGPPPQGLSPGRAILFERVPGWLIEYAFDPAKPAPNPFLRQRRPFGLARARVTTMLGFSGPVSRQGRTTYPG